MKTNKFFAAALAALTLVGFSACKSKEDDKTLELTESSVSMKVGETHQLVANITVEEWNSSDPTKATVVNGLVTAVAEGNAIISATAKGVTKTCIVSIAAAGSNPGGDNPGGDNPGGTTSSVKGSEVWPIIMDAVTFDANASKMKGDFRVDDTNNFLHIWASGETYVAGEGTGKNFFGNNEGYVSLTVAAPAGWSGCGFCLGATSAAAAEELRKAIVASPDDYYLHLAMKATTTGNHQFYTFADKSTSFAIGTATIEQGAVIGDFTRDGSWAEFDIPMSQFATALASINFLNTDFNIFCVLSGGQVGSQLNLDAVYFYKK